MLNKIIKILVIILLVELIVIKFPQAFGSEIYSTQIQSIQNDAYIHLSKVSHKENKDNVVFIKNEKTEYISQHFVKETAILTVFNSKTKAKISGPFIYYGDLETGKVTSISLP